MQLNDWDERLDTMTRGLLGLSVSCARCHDHKFDPIRQMDYARLTSVFASTSRALRPFFEIDPKTETRFMWVYQRLFDLHYTANLLESDPGSKPEQAEQQVKKFRQELTALQAEIDAMSKDTRRSRSTSRRCRIPERSRPKIAIRTARSRSARRCPTRSARARPIRFRIRSASRIKAAAAPRKRIEPQAPFLNSIYDAGVWWNTSESDLTFFDVTPGKPRDLPLYRGGNLGTPTDLAPRGFPLVLAKDAGDFKNGSGRLELGEKIFTDAAPLSARVMVNRVWGWHFDKHLVGTPSDFGIQGLQPTHPELLEDLSARFIASGWSLKWLHKEIMLSATYRQSSKPRTLEMDTDPTNQLMWRMNPRRMDIEAYRDSLLQASGKLDLTMYGPSQPDVDAGVRRTMYSSISRGRSNDVMRLYDVPAPLAHIPMRQLTLNPLQALFVMNSAFVQEQARALAEQVAHANDRSTEATIQLLYRRIFSRDASPDEVALGVAYVRASNYANYAQALLSTNEVIFWP